MALIEGAGVARPAMGVKRLPPAYNVHNLRVKLVHPDAVSPTRAHEEDAALDLYSVEDKLIVPNDHAAVDIGVAVEIPDGVVGLVFARSGMGFKHNVTLSNGIGVVDSTYRGTLMVALSNHHKSDSFRVAKGDRIAQLVLVPIILGSTEVVDSLSDTERGESGFGSTGS